MHSIFTREPISQASTLYVGSGLFANDTIHIHPISKKDTELTRKESYTVKVQEVGVTAVMVGATGVLGTVPARVTQRHSAVQSDAAENNKSLKQSEAYSREK